MDLILAFVAAFTVSIQSILKKKYGERARGGAFLFCAVSVLFACLFFVITCSDWVFDPIMLIYSLAFALSYSVAVIFSFLAIACGPLALSNLIVSYSLLLPAFFGILFMNETVKTTLFLGIALLAVALYMTGKKKDAEGAEKKEKSLKWLIFITLAFLGNGICSIVQNIYAKNYGDHGKSVFMIIALASLAAFFTVYSLCQRSERENIVHNLKGGFVIAALCGCANGLTNLLVLYLLARLPSSVMFPIISAGGMIFVFVYSLIVLKEKYTTMQKIGYVLGTISIILLNL